MSDPKADLTTTAIDYERAKRHAKKFVDAEETPAHPPLRALTLEELFNRPAPTSLIDQWIPELGLVQIVGAPGSLKTFFALDVSLSIASGQTDFFGYHISKHGAVLYICAEGSGSFQFRVRSWCYEHDADPLTLPFRVIPLPVNLRNPKFQEELMAIVAELNPILIVVDTLSRCTPGAEENSARDMGEVVNFCSELQKPSRAAIAFVHHPAKSDPKGGGRGSGVIFGAVDTEIRIDTEDEEDSEAEVEGSRQIKVICTKQKDDMRPRPLDLVGCVVPVRDLKGREMAHESGRPVTSIVLRKAEIDEQAAATRAGAVDLAIDKKILKLMRDYPAATSQQKLRQYARLKNDVVADSVGRILRARWAEEGKRGEPYVITDEGKKILAELTF